MGDTFALLARTASQTRTQLLRNAGRKVLFYLERVEPSTASPTRLLTLSCEVSPIPEALFGAADAPSEYWLTKEERDELELRTAQAADGLLQQVQQYLMHVTDLHSLHQNRRIQARHEVPRHHRTHHRRACPL